MLSLVYRLCDKVRHRARLTSGPPAQAWGLRGEDLAMRFLQKRRYVVVARNYQTPSGNAEVDLIAMDGPTLVFVEVKTRVSDDHGPPDAAVDREKRRKIVRGAAEYVRRLDQPETAVRFDIINVLFGGGEQVEHIPDAFTAASL